MALAEVKTLYESNRVDVPASLRLIADEIERGDLGEIGTCAVVVMGSSLEVFGLGPDSAGPTIHLVLHAGANKLQHGLLEHGALSVQGVG